MDLPYAGNHKAFSAAATVGTVATPKATAAAATSDATAALSDATVATSNATAAAATPKATAALSDAAVATSNATAAAANAVKVSEEKKV